jgi:hypothetical protein
MDLARGTIVTLCNLKSAPALNGEVAIVVGPADGRLAVRLTPAMAATRQTATIRILPTCVLVGPPVGLPVLIYMRTGTNDLTVVTKLVTSVDHDARTFSIEHQAAPFAMCHPVAFWADLSNRLHNDLPRLIHAIEPRLAQQGVAPRELIAEASAIVELAASLVAGYDDIGADELAADCVLTQVAYMRVFAECSLICADAVRARRALTDALALMRDRQPLFAWMDPQKLARELSLLHMKYAQLLVKFPSGGNDAEIGSIRSHLDLAMHFAKVSGDLYAEVDVLFTMVRHDSGDGLRKLLVDARDLLGRLDSDSSHRGKFSALNLRSSMAAIMNAFGDVDGAFEVMKALVAEGGDHGYRDKVHQNMLLMFRDSDVPAHRAAALAALQAAVRVALPAHGEHSPEPCRSAARTCPWCWRRHSMCLWRYARGTCTTRAASRSGTRRPAPSSVPSAATTRP